LAGSVCILSFFGNLASENPAMDGPDYNTVTAGTSPGYAPGVDFADPPRL
jgi:hypothetical protein